MKDSKSKPRPVIKRTGTSRRLVKGTYVADSAVSTGMFAALVKAMGLNNKPRKGSR